MKYELPSLPYGYDTLEPYIDTETMKIHHFKHHQAYITKLNMVLEKYPEIAKEKLEDLLNNFKSLKMAEIDKTMFKNNAGGHLNHTFFWEIMGPVKELDQGLIQEIEKEFSSILEFKKIFTEKAVNHFGSGWAFLVKNEKGKLEIYSLPNQDSPYLLGHTPLIGLDVWEHAYYLKYQNRRPEYVKNWWQVLKLI